MMSFSERPRRDSSAKRSDSRSRTSRPTTPLRPSSRSSLRDSARNSVAGDGSFPLNSIEPAFAELADAMADLEDNMMHFQLMHESLARFSESFGSFLYGLNMNAFCVDFPEAPVAESFKKARQQQQQEDGQGESSRDTRDKSFSGETDGDMTFMTTDTSFLDNPPTATKTPSKFSAPKPPPSRVPPPGQTRGGTRGGRGGTGIPRGGSRPSRLAQPRGRGGVR